MAVLDVWASIAFRDAKLIKSYTIKLILNSRRRVLTLVALSKNRRPISVQRFLKRRRRRRARLATPGATVDGPSERLTKTVELVLGFFGVGAPWPMKGTSVLVVMLVCLMVLVLLSTATVSVLLVSFLVSLVPGRLAHYRVVVSNVGSVVLWVLLLALCGVRCSFCVVRGSIGQTLVWCGAGGAVG